MAPLATAGYHVLAPDQRGYGVPQTRTSRGVRHRAADGRLVGLPTTTVITMPSSLSRLGAIVVWNLCQCCIRSASPAVINLSVPFMATRPIEWVSFWEKMLGADF